MLTRKEEIKLRDAWHGKSAASDLARRFGMTVRGVTKFWEREKAKGNIPSQQPRPHFRAATSVVPPQRNIEAVCTSLDAPTKDSALERYIERSERLAEQTGMRIPDHDPLLRKLITVHGDDSQRLRDEVGATITKLESGRNIFLPSNAWLVAVQRACDSRSGKRA